MRSPVVAISLLVVLSTSAVSDGQPSKNPDYRLVGDGRFGGNQERPNRPPSRSYDLEHVRIHVTLDFSAKSIEGEVQLTVRPLQKNTTEIPLHARAITVRGAYLADGTKLSFVQTGSGLSLSLPRTAASAERLVVVVKYACSPRTGLFFRVLDGNAGTNRTGSKATSRVSKSAIDSAPSSNTNGASSRASGGGGGGGGGGSNGNRLLQAWTQGEAEDNSAWVPIWDYPNDRTTSEMLITVPAEMTTISNGRLVEISPSSAASTRTWHWREEVPHATYLISFVAGHFVKLEDRAGTVPVAYYVPPGRESTVPLTFGRTPEMIRFFGDLLGMPYPFEKYAQTAVDGFTFLGMENVSASTIDDRALVDEEVKDGIDSEFLVAHELAHQWFGNLVTTRDWANLWLNEGFATFLQALWEGHARGADGLAVTKLRLREWYFSEAKARYRRPLVTPVFRFPLAMADGHSYAKGAMILFMLEDYLGPERFWTGVKTYLHRHANGLVDTHDFARAMSDATGEELDWFFDQWVFRPGHPELSVSWEFDGSSRNVRVDVQQLQQGEGSADYRLPLTIEVWTEPGCRGKPQRFRALVDSGKQTFYFPVRTRPSVVLLDPERTILATIKSSNSPEETISLLSHPRAIARIEAAAELATVRQSPLVVAALGKCLKSAPFYGVRQACGRALGQHPTPAAHDALAQCLLENERDPRARETAAEALGRFPYAVEPRAAVSLRRALEVDPSPVVRGAAAASLGRIRAPFSRDTLAKALETDSWQDRVRQGALTGIGWLMDPSLGEVVLAAAAAHRDSRTRAAAIETAIKLEKLKPEPSRTVRETALAMLAEDDFVLQRGVLLALAHATDPGMLDELDAWARNAAHERLRAFAENAAKNIRSSQARQSSANEIKKKLGELEDADQELRRRLELLERNAAN
ncbi:MAG: M1 family metallopeptidase [Pseudomonadota bacterium]